MYVQNVFSECLFRMSFQNAVMGGEGRARVVAAWLVVRGRSATGRSAGARGAPATGGDAD